MTTACLALFGLAVCAGLPPEIIEADGIRIECRSDEVVAFDGERETWRLLHGSLSGDRVRSPIVHDGLLYYGVRSHALVVDYREGRVVRRLVFGDRVKSLKSTDGGVEITWGRERGPYGSGRHVYTESFLYTPGGPEPPPRFTWTNSCDASSIANDLPRPIWQALREGRLEEEHMAEVERVLVTLAEQAARDPTNPWLRTHQASILLKLGREDEARARAEESLALEGSSRVMLLGVSISLERLGYRDLAEEAFAAGYRLFLESGGEPELVSTGLSRLYGYINTDLQGYVDNGELDDAASVLERAWKVAPLMEGAALAYAGMAMEFERAGRQDMVALWQARAAEAWPHYWTGFAVGNRRLASWAMPLALAAVFGGMVAQLFLGLRFAARAQLLKGASPNPADLKALSFRKRLREMCRRRYATRRELAAAALLCAVAGGCLLLAIPGLAAVSRGFDFDTDVRAGNWGSWAAWISLDSLLPRNPAGDELRALSLIKAGRLDEAEALIGPRSSAEAMNNLGAIHAMRGRDEDAAREYERALALKPDMQEALHNLGRPAGGTRVERARKYLPDRPLLAMPSARTYSRAIASPSPPHRYGEPDIASSMRIPAMVFLTIALLTMAALLAPGDVRPPEAEDYDWWAALAVPGIAREYAPWGAAVLMAYVLCAMTPGIFTIFDPMIGSYDFGISAPLAEADPLRAAIVAAAPALVWALPIASACGMIAIRLIRRKSWRSGLTFPRAVIRSAIMAAAGAMLLAFTSAVALRLPGAILLVAAAASAAIAVAERRHA